MPSHKLDQMLPGINSLSEALRTFGLKSRDELTQTAGTFKTAWEQIRNSITVALSDKVKAFEQYRAAAVAANGGVVTSEIRVQEEILRARAAAEGAGKSIGDSMDSAGRRADTRSVFEELNSASAILSQVREMAGRQPKTESAAAPPRAAQGAVRTLNINLGGRQTRVNVASDADANALTGVLRALESAQGTAS